MNRSLLSQAKTLELKDEIIDMCQLFKVSYDDLIVPNRLMKLVDVRKFIAYHLSVDHQIKDSDIADLMNKKRTSIYYYINDFKDRKDTDKVFIQMQKNFKNTKIK